MEETNAPSIDEVKALDGKIFAMLSDRENEVYKFYRNQGRKYGVAISIVNKANQEELSRAASEEQAEQIMKSANSLVSVAVIEYAEQHVCAPELFSAEAEARYTDTDGNLRFDKP